MSNGWILVVDDEPDIRSLVSEILVDEGFEVEVAGTVEEAQLQRRRRRFDLVLLDIWMPDGDGISLLKAWAEQGMAHCPVIMMSGHGTVESAVEATRLGAYDFLEKPLSIAKLTLTVTRALEAERLSRENMGLKRKLARAVYPEGSSLMMGQLREQVDRIAQHDTWVLILGEQGVGKQTFARYIHDHSSRAEGPFIEVPVSAMTAAEAAAEIFGLEQGQRVRYGLLEQADGGTLFLDEVSHMDLQTQGRLLTALESQRLTRVGGTESLDIDVRIVASTQEDLRVRVTEGRFRDDFYYRLSVVPLRVPPLREHAEDIPDLLRHYVELLNQQEGLPKRSFSQEAFERLSVYPWPGNVHELRNLVQRLLILGNTPQVTLAEVESALGAQPLALIQSSGQAVMDLKLPLREAREQFEREYFSQQLGQVDGSMTRLAERVGLERTHVYRKLRALGIEPKKTRD